jgi:hypothetical protein
MPSQKHTDDLSDAFGHDFGSPEIEHTESTA